MRSELDIINELKAKNLPEQDIINIIMTYNMLLSFLIAQKIEPNKITLEAVRLFIADLEEYTK